MLINLQNCFHDNNSDVEKDDKKSEQSDEAESNNKEIFDIVKIIKLNDKVVLPKWYSKVKIIFSQDYSLDVIAIIDFGSDLNCIQRGLIPGKYFEKSTKRLNSTSRNCLHIKYELNNVHVCQNNVCFHIPTILVKNMFDKVILGLFFIAMLYPFSVDETDVSTIEMGINVKFHFASRFDIDVSRLNMIFAKTKHLNFLKQKIRYKRITEQLSDKLLQ